MEEMVMSRASFPWCDGGARAFAAMVAFALATAAPVAAADADPVLPGAWKLTPLVHRGAAVPGAAGTFDSFTGVTELPNRLVLFWASLSGGDGQYQLFSSKEGQVTRVLFDGAPLSVKSAQETGGILFPGKASAYFNVAVGGRTGVGAWDGERAAPLLVKGSSVQVAGRSLPLLWATVVDVDADGRAIVWFGTGKPMKTTGLLALDGGTATPILWEGSPVPGVAGAIVDQLPEPWSGQGAPFGLAPGAILARLKVKGGRETLFRIAAEKTEKVVAVGDPDATFPGKGFDYFGPIAGVSPDALALVTHTRPTFTGLSVDLTLFTGGSVRKVFGATLPGVADAKSFLNYELQTGVFPNGGAAPFVFTAMLGQVLPEAEWKSLRPSLLGWTSAEKYGVEKQTHLFIFDGQATWHLSASVPIDYGTVLRPLASLGPGPLPPSAVLVRGSDGGASMRITAAPSGPSAVQLREGKAHNYLLQFAGEPVLAAVPRFDVTEFDGRIGLEDVVAFRSSTEALIARADGIYVLHKVD
jgi:hypothetical protein